MDQPSSGNSGTRRRGRQENQKKKAYYPEKKSTWEFGTMRASCRVQDSENRMFSSRWELAAGEGGVEIVVR